MPECIIEIKDEVNVKIHDLDLVTRRQLEKKFKYFLPHAFHVPAYKLGRWDGCVSFFSVGGVTYLNLLDEIIPILNEKYVINIKDHRKNQTFSFDEVTETIHGKLTWPKGHTHEGKNIVLRDYQVEIVNQFLAEPQCLQEIATGAGKTLITATLSYCVEPYGRSIVIVPNKDLVTQTEDDYKNLGLDVGVFFGDRKDIGKTHTICTWQSLNSMDKRYKDGEIDVGLKTFAKGVVCIMVDEVHMAKADVLRKLLTGPFASIPIRWGLTGTIPQEEHQFVSLKASLGNVINRLRASDLQEQEVLANCEINIVQIQDTVQYPNYQSELTYLTTNSDRLDYLSELFKDIVKEGNTLVLVDRIKAGEMLQERLGDESVFISGSVKSAERREQYNEVQDSNNKVIIATYGVASVGINIPRIFNLVLVEPGKSFIRVIQSIGRGIRKAQDKDFVKVWDITSSAKFSKRHLTKRKKFYTEAKYPFTIQKTTI
jgi:superfamily II DNA or RNA helicase|tara:strand:+ start:8579 stop:10030 length:1452 start_codon:yes stop_codon:yes gene_type:complete